MMFAPAPIHLLWILVTMAIVFGLIALFVWAVVRGSSGQARSSVPPFAPGPAPLPPGAAETPLDILARRFAKGEITAEEFEKGRDLLGGGKSS